MDHDNKQEFFIQPWTSPSEFIQCYEEIFQSTSPILVSLDNYIASLSTQKLIKALRRLLVWQSRNDNKAFSLSSFLLVDSIIKINSGEYNDGNIDTSHILAEKIIRVTNLIIDELKKTKKTSNVNMFLVANDIDLPECIIETRHACTHKNLPHYNTLIFTIKFLFLWIKNKMWDKQYALYIKEQKYYDAIVSHLSPTNINSKKDKDSITGKSSFKNESNEEAIHLEIDHLMEIIVMMFKLVKDKVQFDKKKKMVLVDSIDIVIGVYKQLQVTEGEFSFLMIFLFISQQMLIIINEDMIHKKDIGKYTKETEVLAFFAKFATRYYTIKGINLKANRSLIERIYVNLYQAVQYSNCFAEIMNSFLFIIKDHQLYQGISDKDLDMSEIYLYQIGSVPVEEAEASSLRNSNIKANVTTTTEHNDDNNHHEDIAMKGEYNERDFIQEYYNTLIL